ncbi:MAG: GNAT family N-acetyltransferase [Saprospiraceae bacterium]
MHLIIKEISPAATWPIRHQVMWPNESFDYIKLPADENGLHFGLWVDDVLISVVSLFIEEGVGQFRKFATLVEEQGKGYGRQLLQHLFKTAQQKGVQKIWCNARITKTAYYGKFGMEVTDEKFIKNGMEYVVMECWLNKK